MVKHFGNIKKSENDDCEYRWLELDNGMKVVLVSSQDVTATRLKLRLESGTSDDPVDMQGLAHATAYTLFAMSSEKQGGNSFVGNLDSANSKLRTQFYQFYTLLGLSEKRDEKFPELLQQFAFWLFNDNFNEKEITKELKAIDLKLAFRETDMYCDSTYFDILFSNPGSLQSKLPIIDPKTFRNISERTRQSGSEDTSKEKSGLQGEIDPERREALTQSIKEFHKQHYIPSKMALFVLSKLDLDTLQKCVSDSFSPILNPPPQTSLPAPETPCSYRKDQLGKFIDIEDPEGSNTMEFTFKVALCRTTEELKHLEFIVELLQYQGEGSLNALLTQEGLISYMYVYRYSYSPQQFDFQKIEFYIRLTSKGNSSEGLTQIAAALGAYLKLLRREGPFEWLYEEMKMTAQIYFTNPQSLSIDERFYGVYSSFNPDTNLEDIVISKLKFPEFDRIVYAKFFDQLTIDNAIIYRYQKELTSTEGWIYDPIVEKKYRQEQFSTDFRTAFDRGDLSWSKAVLGAPQPNKLIPKRFDIKPVLMPQKGPVKVVETESSEVWHWQDDTLNTPFVRFNLKISLDRSKTFDSVKHQQMFTIWYNHIRSGFQALSSQIDGIRMQVLLTSKDNSISIKVHLYADVLLPVLNRVVALLAGSTKEINEASVEELKQEEIERIESYFKDSTSCNLSHLLGFLLHKDMPCTAEQMEAIKSVTFDELKKFSVEVLSKIRFEWAFEGNLNSNEAVECAAKFESDLKALIKYEVLPLCDAKTGKEPTDFREGETHCLEIDQKIKDLTLEGLGLVFRIGKAEEYLHYVMVCRFLFWVRFKEFTGANKVFKETMVNYTKTEEEIFLNFSIDQDELCSHTFLHKFKTILTRIAKRTRSLTKAQFEQELELAFVSTRKQCSNLKERFLTSLYFHEPASSKFEEERANYEKMLRITPALLADFIERHLISKTPCIELHYYSPDMKEDSEALRRERASHDASFIYHPTVEEFKQRTNKTN